MCYGYLTCKTAVMGYDRESCGGNSFLKDHNGKALVITCDFAGMVFKGKGLEHRRRRSGGMERSDAEVRKARFSDRMGRK